MKGFLTITGHRINQVLVGTTKSKYAKWTNISEEKSPDCAKTTLQAIIRKRVDPDRIIHSDGWRGYNGLVDLGYKKHYRVHHGRD